MRILGTSSIISLRCRSGAELDFQTVEIKDIWKLIIQNFYVEIEINL